MRINHWTGPKIVNKLGFVVRKTKKADYHMRKSSHIHHEIVGYRSLTAFFKVFRRFTNMTPLGFAKTIGYPPETTRILPNSTKRQNSKK